MAAVTLCIDFGVQGNKVSPCYNCFPFYLPWRDGTGCHDLSFLSWVLSQLFPFILPLSSRGSLVPTMPSWLPKKSTSFFFFNSSIVGLRGEGNSNPLQDSCLENPMDRGAWYATDYGVTKSRTRLSDFTSLHFTSRAFLEKAMAPHSSTLAWKIPWMQEPGRLQSMWLQRVGHDWSDLAAAAAVYFPRRQWHPIPVFLPGKSHGCRSLVGCRPWGG